MKSKVYYDGLCHLCSREIEHYRKLEGSEQLEFVDITAASFDPAAEGLDPVKINKEMHVRRADGSLAIGVDAFLEIWSKLPHYQLLEILGRRPFVNFAMQNGYKVFSKIRPWLPRKKENCGDSPYCGV